MRKDKNYFIKLGQLKEKVERVECMKYTLNSIVYWDKITHMPSKGIHYRSKIMGVLGSEIYSSFSDPALRELVGYFESRSDNDVQTDSMLKRIKRNYVYVNQIPEKEYRDYIALIATAEQVWASAKAENNFESFAPYLEKIVESFKNFSEYWGYDEDPYDALIGYYEEGVTTKDIDGYIERIKPEIIRLLTEINKRKSLMPEEMQMESGGFAKEQQMELTKAILEEIGFDFQAGRVDEGDHPTVLAASPGDVRLITVFDEHDIIPGIFNALHIGGKGLYEQGIDEGLLGMLLAEVASFGMEEAVARLYENVIGRNHGFWEHFYEKLQTLLPQFQSVSMEAFYRNINRVEAKAIRLEADELTYMLHTIIRYEIERDLISNRISIENLKEVWNEKYQAYLGVAPQTDSEGILQDVHWAAGYFGYFPSYIFANILSAQIADTMESALGNLDELLRRGELYRINDWLVQNIYHQGAVETPVDLIRKISGESLHAEHYVNYLWNKYSKVYQF